MSSCPFRKVARHVCAIDIDPNLLEVACHRLAENGLTNCDFVSGDPYDIAKLTAPADFVFLANAFHGVADRARARNVRRRTVQVAVSSSG
ncbi:MAG: methyltransferase domain-containing protein [Pseudolabrys sp.]